MLLFSTVLY